MITNWFINEHIFNHPFTCLVVGPTQSGKTVLLKEILKYRNHLFNSSPDRIIFCYAAWQNTYESLRNDTPSIEFNEGVLDIDLLNGHVQNLIIFDDLMADCNKNEKIMNLFTVGSHHHNTSVFFITQNIFSKGKYTRDISLNSNYLIILKNPRDQLQFQILARQMFPNKTKFLLESFENATSQPHGYLLFDLKQTTEDRNRIQTNILPYQLRIIYTPK
jgi:hypothetical protein